MNLEELFGVDHEQLRNDVDYRMEEFFLAISENIAKAMKDTGIKTKGELAKRLGVTPGRVSALLSGYKKNVELRTIVQIALALNVTPHELCAPRKTREMIERPLFGIQGGYEQVEVAPELNHDDNTQSLSA